MKNVFFILALIGSIALLLSASTSQCGAKIINQCEMQKVVGGGCSGTVCLNFCNGSGCNGTCKKGDLNELCGSTVGEGVAYGCMAGGGENDNCTLTGSDSTCDNELCHCGNGPNCYKDQTKTKNKGKSECSD